jgi:hypothetical protein
MSDQKDPVAERRNSTAAIFRATLWPLVALATLWYLGGSIERLVNSLQSVSFAGVEIRRWAADNALTATQRRALEDMSPSEVAEFFQQYGPDRASCYKSAAEVPERHKIFEEAGLVAIGEAPARCTGSTAVTLTRSGENLWQSLSRIISDTFSQNLRVD